MLAGSSVSRHHDQRRAKRPAAAALQLQIDAIALQPLIEAVVAATVAQLDADRAKLDGKLCYSEDEAAQLLDLEPHVLRDERRRGRIGASSIVDQVSWFRSSFTDTPSFSTSIVMHNLMRIP